MIGVPSPFPHQHHPVILPLSSPFRWWWRGIHHKSMVFGKQLQVLWWQAGAVQAVEAAKEQAVKAKISKEGGYAVSCTTSTFNE